MRLLRVPRWRKLPLGLLAVLAVVTLAGCTGGTHPQSTLAPKGDYAEMVDGLFMKTVYLATIVFVLVEGALLWAIFKFRGKPTDPAPEQTHGNTMVEIVWTVIPAVVLAIVAVPTVKTIFATAKVPTVSADGQVPLKVEVIGHQWWWEFRYPELGITTANELHVPVGRTIDLRMKSFDVIHSFWIPQFAGKRDVFPNRETRLWFTAKVGGAYPGACAEFCGLQHGRMDFYVMADSPEEFATWKNNRLADTMLAATGLPKPAPKPDTTVKAPAVKTGAAAPAAPVAVAMGPAVADTAMDPQVAEGMKLFSTKGCMGCHTSSAMTPMKGMVGPNLSGIGSRKMIAAGWLPNTDDNLKRWLHDPQAVKSGVGMIIPKLTDVEVNALVAYLRTKR
ncbi:MAG: cytochrome c oxidase subunit II [Gemmatimonadota bacterium]